MRSVFRAAVCAFVLCGAPSAFAQETPAPPPVPAGTEHVLAIEDTGTTLSVKEGEHIAVTLIGKPSIGQSWSVTEQPSFLSAPKRAGGPLTTLSSASAPRVGGSRWDVFTFEVTAPGEEVLKLEQRTLQGATVATFEITVVSAK